MTLGGNGLDQGGSLYFTRSGLTAEHIEKGRFRITVAADAEVGVCDLWVATSTGLAGPRRFSITANPVIVEREGNDTRDTAQWVPSGAAVDARLDRAADLDWFAFEGPADQLVTITGRSPSLDGSAQLVLTLFDPDGRELVHSASHENEPRVTCRMPTAGTYRVLVHDRAYRKDDFSFYRLEVTTEPQHVAKLERTAQLILPDDLFGTIRVQEEPELSPEERPIIELPSRIAGQLGERNEVDWFRFQARKDQVVHIEAFGERLGQLMDLEVAVYDAAGKQLSTGMDLAAPKGIPATLPLVSLDPSIDWKAPADGEFALALRDLYGGSIFGADRIYELIVATPQPNVTAIASPAGSSVARGVFLKPGGHAEVSLTVIRSGGFAGPVKIRAMESTDGVAVEPIVVDAKEVTKAIRIVAAQDAPAGFRSLRLVTEAEIGSDTLTTPVLNAVQIRSGVTRRVDEMVIYISE